MTFTVNPRYSPNFDYTGTFFDGLKVMVLLPDADQECITVEKPTAVASKSYQPRDLRYNTMYKQWTLDELIARLDLAASFGPSHHKPIERHAEFDVLRNRPEDGVLTINQLGTCLNEWVLQPIYKAETFDSLLPAISTLKNIQAYVEAGEF